MTRKTFLENLFKCAPLLALPGLKAHAFLSGPVSTSGNVKFVRHISYRDPSLGAFDHAEYSQTLHSWVDYKKLDQLTRQMKQNGEIVSFNKTQHSDGFTTQIMFNSFGSFEKYRKQALSLTSIEGTKYILTHKVSKV